MGNHLLVPPDGSEQADETLAYTYQEVPNATVTLLHIINPARARERRDSHRGRTARRSIVNYAADDINEIVTGSHGRQRVS